MKTLRIVIILIILIFFTAFLIFTFHDDPQRILLDYIDNEEWNNGLILIIIFVLTMLSTATGLPVLYLSVALGFMLNLPLAYLLAWGMNFVAVMLTFLMVKKVYRGYFMQHYGKKKIIQRINRRIEKYGLWTVAIARGIYVIPTNIINFSFPLSKISFKNYITGTMIGLLPEILINVSAGFLLKHQMRLLSDPQENLIEIVAIALLFLIMVGIILVIRHRRKKGKQAKINKIVPRMKND